MTGLAQREEQLVDHRFQHFALVNLNAKSRLQLHLPGKCPHHLLEEGVDGHHGKVRIAVQELAKHLPRSFGKGRTGQSGAPLQLLVQGFVVAPGQLIEEVDDAGFHLLSRLIGESDRQDAAVGDGLTQRQGQVLQRQGVGLARPGRRAIDDKGFFGRIGYRHGSARYGKIRWEGTRVTILEELFRLFFSILRNPAIGPCRGR